MFAILLAGIAFLVYTLSLAIGVGWVVAAVLVVVVILGLLPYMGIFIGHKRPLLARWLMWTWTPAVTIVAASAGALITFLSLYWIAGQDADLSKQVVFGLIGGVLTAVATGFKDWVKVRLAPWRTKTLACEKYRPIFPCSPVELGPGRTAYERLSDMCRTSGSDAWGGGAVEQLLRDISAAVSVGQYHGGPNWECL